MFGLKMHHLATLGTMQILQLENVETALIKLSLLLDQMLLFSRTNLWV
jgi:hypothetical protein